MSVVLEVRMFVEYTLEVEALVAFIVSRPVFRVVRVAMTVSNAEAYVVV